MEESRKVEVLGWCERWGVGGLGLGNLDCLFCGLGL